MISNGSRPPLSARRLAAVLGGLTLLLAGVVVAAVSIGSVRIPVSEVAAAMTGGDVAETSRAIVLELRLPRVLMAIAVGAGLSVAGVVFQALLRNSLAEPYILGISSGGTVGALLALGLALGLLAVPAASFLGSMLVMGLVYAVGHRRGRLDTNTLLLAGVMIGAFFNAAVLLVVAVFFQEMRNAFLWLMGNLSGASMAQVALVGPVVLLAAAAIVRYAKNYNLIATGDEAAMQLGVDVRAIKRRSYLLASLVTGVVVSVSGVVGFVGLIIPHICRLMFGPDHRVLLPASFLLGASFLVLADLVARTALAPVEIPVGAVTAALGAPLFVYLLKRN